MTCAHPEYVEANLMGMKIISCPLIDWRHVPKNVALVGSPCSIWCPHFRPNDASPGPTHRTLTPTPLEPAS